MMSDVNCVISAVRCGLCDAGYVVWVLCEYFDVCDMGTYCDVDTLMKTADLCR